MLREGMSVDVSIGNGWTALGCATWHDQTDVIKLLVGEGADVNRQDVVKGTPLHMAARNNKTEAVRLLLDNGADINLKNIHKKTPLDEACKGSEVERLLLQP